jgi:response regulator of citrate/malate metabolism
MGNNNIRVIVIDDDFMIAKLHAGFIEKQEGYEIAGTAHSYDQALPMIRTLNPDLVVLDVYLPDHSGIEILRTIRTENASCDSILITAAKEITIIEEAFRLGIFDYLIKPFDFDLLKNTLAKYLQFKSHLKSPGRPDQKFVDELKKLRAPKFIMTQNVSKGIDSRTMDRIMQSLVEDNTFHTAETIAQISKLSRSTARGYLDFMVSHGIAEEFLQYGTVGRPMRLFRLKKSAQKNLTNPANTHEHTS